ncbi:MAG: tRNA uridine-5-carboxymethylaminomethyl(34) synthesis GTPase MnmE [Clostridiales bacterium]|nr:tRNA uridine-5-carboxymethylaminomethyl(34) synthesis GTPase MnmE [Clostridiales bacterium]
MLEDTIIAISTPAGYGGLGIVRLSGERALGIARKIFKPKKNRGRIPPRSLVLGEVYDREKDESIDEAYLVFFPKPRSYTCENAVEITCHGSPVILEEVVRLGIRAGARPAHPGEFTLRAYLRGRIDILQAEAVNDLITAASLEQAKISFGQLKGKLSRKIGELRRKIINVLSQVEAAIEFPEDGLPIGPEHIGQSLKEVIAAIGRLIESYEAGRTMTEGLSLAIVGKANVGKSTLFNALLDEERAIVSPYPGTTRDYLRERMTIKGSVFQLVDMAGLDKPSHPIEEEGIRRGLDLASRADGILLVLDSSRPETQADLRLIRNYRHKKTIFLFNKCDLTGKIDKEKCKALDRKKPWLDISALNGTNLGKLKEAIHRVFVPKAAAGEEVIFHQRQKFLLEKALIPLEQALKLMDQGYTEEMVAEEIRQALPAISSLTGEIRPDDVINSIFSRFCVGK